MNTLRRIVFLLQLACTCYKTFAENKHAISVLVHHCKTCESLNNLSLLLAASGGVSVQTSPTFIPPTKMGGWDVIALGVNRDGCAEESVSRHIFIHEVRYMLSLYEQDTSPVIVLIADGTNYVCTDQGQDRGFLKRLDVDGIISPRRDNEDAAGPPVFESFFHGKNGDATKFLNIIKRMTSGKPFRPWRPRLGIVHYRPKSTPWGAFEKGFQAALKLLERDYVISWINLDSFEGKQLEDIDLEKFNRDFDVIFVKSNWHWTVDNFVRGAMRHIVTPKALLISGVADPPAEYEELVFYDLLYYETNWYRPKIAHHPKIQRAFGIDTSVMRPMPQMNKTIDSLFVGWFANYKRPWLFGLDQEVAHPAFEAHAQTNLVAIGKLDGTPEAPELIASLQARGVKVMGEVPYQELAVIMNQAKQVHIPAHEHGGGERAVLEARACGTKVKIEEDNVKLKELLEGPILSASHYAKMLRSGLSKLIALPRPNARIEIVLKGKTNRPIYTPGEVLYIIIKLANYNPWFDGRICCKIVDLNNLYNYTEECRSSSGKPMVRLTTSIEVPKDIVGRIRVSCSLKSYVYDDGETSSNFILLNNTMHRPSIGVNTNAVLPSLYLINDKHIVRSKSFPPQVAEYIKNSIHEGGCTEEITISRSVLVIYDSLDKGQKRGIEAFVKTLIAELEKGKGYRAHFHDIKGGISNPETNPSITVPDAVLRHFQSQDCIIAVGTFRHSADYLTAFLRHVAKLTLPKVFIDFSHVPSWPVSEWSIETYSMLICIGDSCAKQYKGAHQNVLEFHTESFVADVSQYMYLPPKQHRAKTCMFERNVSRHDQGDWSIGMYFGDRLESLRPMEEDDRFKIETGCGFLDTTSPKNPVIQVGDIYDIPSLFVADPFLQIGPLDGHIYMLFESLDMAFRGFIGAAVSKDVGVSWTYLGAALEETFHLSFPYTFCENDMCYMIPEAHKSDSVRLYQTKSNKFPFGWKFSHALLEGAWYQDTGLVKHDEHWYLFTTTAMQPNEWRQRLYVSDSLRGPYVEHPHSPVTHLSESCTRGRLGGRIIQTADHKGTGLIRFSQSAEPKYGSKLYANIILTLTPYDYKETLLNGGLPVLEGSNDPGSWNEKLMHHLDAIYDSNRGVWVAVVDGAYDGKGLRCEK
jgi:hypothetical protein